MTAVRAVLLTLALAAGLLLSAPAVAPPAGAAPTVADGELEVVLEEMVPRFGVPGSALRVVGTVRNQGDEAVEDPVVRLRASRVPVSTRGDVSAIADEGSSARRGFALPDTEVSLGPTLLPGGTASFTLTYPLDELRLPRFGVYVVGVQAGTRAGGGFRERGLTRTFLPWVPPEQGFRPSRIAWVWPLVDVPVRDGVDAFRDDHLAASMAPSGRLAGLVAAAAGQPVTWTVDPMLLEDAAIMTDGYRLAAGGDAGGGAGPEGTPVEGAGAETARAWLEALRAAVSADGGGSEVVALPYATVDANALVDTRLAVDIDRAVRISTPITRRVLGPAVTGRIAWAASGRVGPQAAAALTTAGVGAVLVSELALPPVAVPSFTPDARERIELPGGAATTLLLFDQQLSVLAGTPATEQGGSLLAEQRFLAETAMVTAELPSRPRAVVVAPTPLWDPDPAHAAALVRLTTQAPWLRPVTLSEVAAGPPEDAPAVERRELVYPPAAAAAELPAAYLEQVRLFRVALSTLSRVLTEPTPVVDPLSRAALRLESATWRDRVVARQATLDRVRDRLRSLEASVSLLPTSVTLGSSSAEIPITLVNDLDQPVTVAVELTAQSPRLAVEDTEAVTVGANVQKQVLVPVQARANGEVVVQAQLTSPDGRPLGEPVELQVRVVQYDAVAGWVTGVATAVLLLAAARRLLRRGRDRRRARQAAGSSA